MLLEFSVANFRSFKEKQSFSMVASRDDTYPDNLHVWDGDLRLLRTAAVYGANASGKSNLVKAMRVMRNIILRSPGPGDEIIDVTPFRLCKELCDKPSFFQIKFIIEDTIYDYSFSATSERIYEERLYGEKKSEKRRLWFERLYNPAAGGMTWQLSPNFGAAEKILKEATRENVLLFSRAADLNIGDFLKLYQWFRLRLWIFDLSIPPEYLISQTTDRVQNDDSFRSLIVTLLRQADLGINDLRVEPTDPEDLLSDDPKMRRVLLSRMRRHGGLSIKTIHSADNSEPITFDFDRDESNGTQRFFALIGPIMDALRNGSTLVVDELECSMHPNLVRRLIEMFQSKIGASTGAQLVFASHDSSLFDLNLFRRDQLWLVDKTDQSSSRIYSLYDFKTGDRPRKTTATEKNYLAGRYGGVPKFGPFFEDLELPK